MLAKIIQFSIQNKLIIGMLTIGLIVGGVYAVSQLPIDAVPDITNNQVLVITTAPSMSATDMERLVTLPIEEATRNIPGIVEQRSFSRSGLSLITIVFTDKTDVYWARQQVSERLNQISKELPNNIAMPTLGPVSTGLGEVFQYVVKTKPGYENQYNLSQLREIQDWIVRKQLLGTEGVAEVSSFGGKVKQYEVAIQPEKLKNWNLSIQDVYDAIENNNQNAGGAYIEKGDNVYFIRTEGLSTSIADLNNIVVKQSNNQTPVLVRDVANVQVGTGLRYGATLYNDEGEVAGAVVMMTKGENSNKVIKNIKTKIAAIEKNLPPGVIIEPFLDRTKMVNNAIKTIETNLLEGAIIVIAVLIFFLGNMRSGLVVASVIPLSMLFAVICMNLTNVSGNLMSLGAIDFGLLVDGAIIIIEAVLHSLFILKVRDKINILTQNQLNETVEKATNKMMRPAIFGQIIILIVYLPILSLQGIEGKMFRPMAQTVAYAMIGAIILSVTYVPMMISLMLKKKIADKVYFSDRMFNALQKKYNLVLDKALKVPKLLIIATFSLFLVAVFVLTKLGGEFIPKLEEGDFAVDTRMLTGTSLTGTIEGITQAAGILKKQFPEVEKIVTKIGSGEVPTDPMPIEAADMMVVLKDKKEWTSAKTFDELAEKMSQAVQAVPGLATGFQYPVQMRFNELMTGSKQDVVCKIYGENLDSLAQLAKHIGEQIEHLQGAKDIYVETVTGIPELVIEYNRAAIAKYGVSIHTLNTSIQSAYGGASPGKIYEGVRKFDIMVRLDSNIKNNLEAMQNLWIPLPNGGQIPLHYLATVQLKDGPYQIQHEDASRRIMVGFNVRGADVKTVVKNLQEKIQKNITMPVGYHIKYGGQYENLESATKRLTIAVPIALLLILVLLYFAFGKLKYSLLVFCAIPLAAIGGVFALVIRGMPFSISAGIGFIALFGIAVLNGIVLVSEINTLKITEKGISLSNMIIQGAISRLRPVIMTASVASLGFIPMALSNGAGAEVQRPLATVVIGGLCSATLLTLFVLPCLYLLTEKSTTKKPQ